MISRPKKILFVSVLVGFSVLFVTGMGELLVRLIAPQPILPRFVESAPWGIRRVIGHVDALHKTPEYSYRYTTNSEGFRGQREYSPEPPAGVYRIVVQGDSVTLGHGVADTETFSYILERSLLADEIRVEVINMGVSGFGTAEEIIQFENVGKKYRPHLVILAYFQNDDLNNHVSQLFELSEGQLKRKSVAFQPGIGMRDMLSKVPFYPFLSQHSHLFTLLRNRVSALILNRLHHQRHFTERDSNSDASAAEASPLTRALLVRYASDVKEFGSDLIIIDIVDKKFRTDFPSDVDSGERLDIVRTRETFLRAERELGDLFYQVDSHPTPKGHAVIARILHGYVSRKALARE